MNNKTQLSINITLALAVVILFVLHFVAPRGAASETSGSRGVVAAEAVAVQEGNFPIAYIDLDSVLLGYTFAIEANAHLQGQQENALAEFNKKRKTFEKEAADFQRKIDNNAFLSRERAEAEAARLQKKQEELEALNQSLSQKLMLETQKLQAQLADSLNGYIRLLNADGRFHLILADHSHSSILNATSGYDITAEVIEGLNARCR